MLAVYFQGWLVNISTNLECNLHLFCHSAWALDALIPNKNSQIPPDCVVKSQIIDVVDVALSPSRPLHLVNRRAVPGNHGVRGSHHLPSIGLPLNPMECVICYAPRAEGRCR